MTDVTNMEIPNIYRDSSVLLTKTGAGIAINLAILVACVTRSKKLTRRGLDNPEFISLKWVQFTHKKIQYMPSQMIIHQAMNPFACKWSYKLNKPIPSILHFSIYLLVWNLKSSHTRTNPNSSSQNWCLCRCKGHASQYLQVFIQRSRLCQDCTKWFTVRHIHQQEDEAFRILQFICYTSRYKMYHRSNIFAASNEGSILISCTTSLALGLIKTHDRLDHLPSEGNVISSSTDKLKDDTWLKVHILVRKCKLKSSNEKAPIVCSSDGKSKSNKEQFVNICLNEQSSATCTRNTGDKNFQADKSNYVVTKPAMKTIHMWSVRIPEKLQSSNKQHMHEECSVKKTVCDGKKGQSTKFIKPAYEDQKCQSTVCFEKNCQVNMQPVKPEMNMWSKETQSSYKKKHVPLCSFKNCQSTRCYRKPEYTKCDKNCQETKSVHMWPLKLEMKKSCAIQLPKPAMEQSTYKFNQDSKNC